ncbi:aminoglycoside 3'-phosphotransferase [Pendulispora rubella]|uniref:Aminoglycoside 3'-phosphotransferase n=1 Tax=Pendulispora rubella TaxID=2741070 RepID=A0ABZ2KVK0_9BACT
MTKLPSPPYSRYTWTPVTIGQSGAKVFRLDDDTGRPQLYAKSASQSTQPDVAEGLAQEASRLAWLGGQGIAVAEVVELRADGDGIWLITRALPGRSAAEVWPTDRRGAIAESMADIACRLHALPTTDCPFDRRLSRIIPEAEQRAAAGLVDLEDLDDDRAGWSIEQLLRELHATKPSNEDVVVCHGDFCLPNVLVADDGTTVTGLLDVGRLGLADRYADLALMSRSLASPMNEQYDDDDVQRFFTRYGADPADERIAFYRLLDEFY